MDRIDKFINNRPPKKIILVFLITLVLSALASLFIAGKIADFIIREQVKLYLEYEKNIGIYGITYDMPMKLIPEWEGYRNKVFVIIFSTMGICSVVWLIFSLHEVFKIYDELEEIAGECRKSANKLKNFVRLHGNDADCMRRISENIELLASRMYWLNGCMEREKVYLREFLGNFSHQIKNSLAVIRLNTDMVAETENLSSECIEELNNEIRLNLDAIELLVIQAIKLARLEARTIQYNMKDDCFADTCRTAIRRITPVMRNGNITVTADLPQNIMLNHDKCWLCEAIENVLKNSADHSGCTKIHIQLEENPAMVKLSMTDDGKGIPQNDIPTLFEPFAKNSSDINMRSAGLGMSIAQKIVRNHGGEIIVYSKTDKGSCFEFVFVKS